MPSGSVHSSNGVSRCDEWFATISAGPLSFNSESSPLTCGFTSKRSTELSAPFCSTSRTAIAAGVRAHFVGKTEVSFGITYGSADRGTCGRRPHRQPRATCFTSRAVSRLNFTRPVPISARPRAGAAGCAGR